MERNLRIITGLILYLFVATHLINVALGIISPELIEETRKAFMYVWSSEPGKFVLSICILVHMIAGLRTLYFRNTLKMTPSDGVQFLSGFLVAPLLIPHAWGVMAMVEILNVKPTYTILMHFFWIDSPLEGLRQVLLIVVVWIHGSIGIFTWLRIKPWWAQVAPLVYPLIVLIPVCGMLGFVAGGNLAIKQYEESLYTQQNTYQAGEAASTELSDEEIKAQNAAAEQYASDYAFVQSVNRYSLIGYFVVLLLTLLARYLRISGKSGKVTVRYDDGTVITEAVGKTFLELSQTNSIPHAHLCRGRGRCGTCRIRILSSTADISQPSELEANALALTHSDEDVRLACQCVPGAGQVEIARLFQADISPDEMLASRQSSTKDKSKGQQIDVELVGEAKQ